MSSLMRPVAATIAPASTARYRYSTTDNSTSTNPASSRNAPKRRVTAKPNTAAVAHQVGPKCQASPVIGHAQAR
jgi:hypothetical protein